MEVQLGAPVACEVPAVSGLLPSSLTSVISEFLKLPLVFATGSLPLEQEVSLATSCPRSLALTVLLL